MKKELLILGLLPLIFSMMFISTLSLFPGSYIILSIVFLLLWSFVGFKSYKYTQDNRIALINTHLASFIILLLTLFIKVVLKQDTILQIFFLPVLDISMYIYMLIFFFTPKIYSGLIYSIGFILMILSYNLGFNSNKLKYR